MKYKAEVLVQLKEEVLDTQGKAVAGSLKRLGYEEPSVRVGKYILLELDSPDLSSAEKTVHCMCKDLLVNAIIEEYSVKLEESR